MYAHLFAHSFVITVNIYHAACLDRPNHSLNTPMTVQLYTQLEINTTDSTFHTQHHKLQKCVIPVLIVKLQVTRHRRHHTREFSLTEPGAAEPIQQGR